MMRERVDLEESQNLEQERRKIEEELSENKLNLVLSEWRDWREEFAERADFKEHTCISKREFPYLSEESIKFCYLWEKILDVLGIGGLDPKRIPSQLKTGLDRADAERFLWEKKNGSMDREYWGIELPGLVENLDHMMDEEFIEWFLSSGGLCGKCDEE